MHEPIPKSVGERCEKTWKELGPLDLRRLVLQGKYVIDDYLYIEDKDIATKYNGHSNYEG